MKLTSDLPGWLAWPLRLILYAFVMFILYYIAMGIVSGRAANNAMQCNGVVPANEGGLKYAKSMVACLREKNGFFENLQMRSVFRVVDALPSTPREFVGTWDAIQPRCSYRHKLDENGEFTSESRGCSLSSATFHGTWGVYGKQMIWLANEEKMWPPDINSMDVVDKDFFLLVERDGSRTKFTRVADAPGDSVTMAAANSADAAVARGYDWAQQNGITSHAACRSQWTDENHQALERSGCSKYVTEVNVVKVVKPIPQHKGWDDGTTTAQCMAEVHAYWDPVIDDLREQGEAHVASSRYDRDLLPALEQCANFDKVRIIRQVYRPQERLDAILKKMKEGSPFTAKDRIIVQHDYPGVVAYPENEYRTRYLRDAETLFSLVGGRDKVITALSSKYEELYKRLDQLQAEGAGMIRYPSSGQAVAPDGAKQQEQAARPEFESRAQYRARQDQQFADLAQKTQEKNRESAARLTSFLDEIKRTCGDKLQDYPDLGMTDEAFRKCTIYARTGGVKQIVTDTYESRPLRLYVFGNSKIDRVYSIDGVITAIRP